MANRNHGQHGQFSKKITSYGALKDLQQAFVDCWTESDVVLLFEHLMKIATNPDHPKQSVILKLLIDWLSRGGIGDTMPKPLFLPLEEGE